VRHEAPAAIDEVRPPRPPLSARVYAYALLTIALVAVAVLVSTGSPLPAPGTLLLLALPLALCMNRFLFFPNEIGVTADAAVVFAAMVVFANDAVWLGPLVLALLVGPLDVKHWSERAFVRMAYNSGSTTFVVGAALAVFVPLSRAWGPSFAAVIGAAAVAAIAYVLIESVLGIVLVVLLGERPTIALRQQLPLNSIAAPLALIGATAGFAALEIGWWSALVLLLPASLVPELVFVTLPRRLSRSGPMVWLVVAAILLAASLVTPVAGLAALVCLVAAERRPHAAPRVSPLVAVLAVAAVAVIAACTHTAPFRSVVVSAAVGAATLILIVRPTSRATWSLPVVATSACVGVGAARAGPAETLVFVAGMTAALLLAAMWGPLPWPSRLIGPMTAGRRSAHPRAILLTLAALTLGLTAGAIAATGVARTVCALAAAALFETEVMMAALGVRLWRFAPRRRVADAVLLALASTTALLVALPLALAGEMPAIAVTTVCTAIVVLVAWRLPRTPRNTHSGVVSEELDVAHRE
jgi:hypothetical protein